MTMHHKNITSQKSLQNQKWKYSPRKKLFSKIKKGKGVGILYLVGNFFHELSIFGSCFEKFFVLNYYSVININRFIWFSS